MYRRGGVRLDALEHKAEGPGSPSGAFGVQGAGAGRGRGLAFSSEYWQLAMTWQKSSSHRSRLKPRVSVRNPSSDTRTKSDTASTFSLTSSVLCGANRGDGAQRACAQTEPRARPERPAEAAAPPGAILEPACSRRETSGLSFLPPAFYFKNRYFNPSSAIDTNDT